jgi:hypothetical protein
LRLVEPAWAVLGHVADVSAGGVRVCFLRNSDPGLAVGDEVRVQLLIASGSTSPEGTVRVCHRDIRDVVTEYGMEFLAVDDLLAGIAPNLREIFNRRHVQRCRIPDDRPLSVRLEYETGISACRVLDLSTCGLSFHTDEDLKLNLGDEMIIGLELPGIIEPLEFVAVLRDLEPAGGAARCGVEFCEDTIDLVRKQWVIADFCFLHMGMRLEVPEP